MAPLFSFYRNDHPKFLEMKKCFEAVDYLLHLDRFISRREYQPFLDQARGTHDELKTMDRNGVLDDFARKNRFNLKDLRKYLAAFDRAKDDVDRHNSSFVEKHLVSDKVYLDTVMRADDPKILLDDGQRKAVLRDEDYTLVVAGAGAGKTTLIEGKCRYLIDKKGISPDRILVVSFTRKATAELRTRFKKMGIGAKILTFHSLGNSLISNGRPEKRKIVDRGYMVETLRKYLRDDLNDDSLKKKIALFFASYLEIPFNPDKAVDSYKQMLARGAEVTIKGTLENELDRYKNDLERRRVTIMNERVRSREECQIANYLYIHGIDYSYEEPYPFYFPGSNKPYCPDFTIRQGEKVIYLEHYGISEDGQSDRFSAEELAEYKKHMVDKARLHDLHKTKLVETFSRYRDGKSLIYHLRQILDREGIVSNPKRDVEVYYELSKVAEDRYFLRLIQLIANFINRFKVDAYTSDKFADFKANARQNGDERTFLFLDIAHQCFLAYEAALQKDGAIDFEDMINDAASYLDGLYAKGTRLPFDYIFIDEYQDISVQRFNLAEKLAKVSNAKIVAVGDDWQSIYRFSGSDIGLFVDFEKTMGYCDTLYLTSTHRNSQELIDIAGGFVMENDLQKKKSLVSNKHLEDPVIVYSYDDSESKDGPTPYHRMAEAVDKALKDIHVRYGDNGSVLLIGRYSFDAYVLSRIDDLFSYDPSRKTVVCKRFPKLKIDFLTAHSSKGLGYDNVVVINAKDDVLGFPSKIEDDPIMKLVVKEQPEIEYGEERRLFYVALTRTKNRVYLIAPKYHPSTFVLELREKHTHVILNGPSLEPKETRSYRYVCPKCGYPLQERKPRRGMEKFLRKIYVCSNDPEVCGFSTNDVSGNQFKLEISKCPSCASGYLIVKRVKDQNGHDSGRRILGCSNYKPDGTGCNFTLGKAWLDTPEKISRDRDTYERAKLPLSSCCLLNYPVTDLLKGIFKSIEICNEHRLIPSIYGLSEFMRGEESKRMKAFSLVGARGFGWIGSDRSQKEVLFVLRAMVDFGFLEEYSDEKGYKVLRRGKRELNENSARSFFETFLN